MAKLDVDQLRSAAYAIPQDGLTLEQLLAMAPGGKLPAMIVLCTLPAALPGLQLGWVCVPVLFYLSYSLWKRDSAPKLPERLASFWITSKAAHSLLKGMVWTYEKCGRHCRSTFPWLVRRVRHKPAAVLVSVMSSIILLPLPGSNVLPAMAIVILMAGLVWRDGRAVIAAGALSVLSISIVFGFAWAARAAYLFYI